MKKLILISIAAAMLLITSNVAMAKSVKIGFITTLTTGVSDIGLDMKHAVELAVEHINGKMGPLDVEVIFEDDGFKPEIGKQKADKLVKSDNVDFVGGFIWSHVLLASQRSVLKAGKFLISSNAGPSQMAGKQCHKNFFSTSWENSQTTMAMGEYLNQIGVKKLYIMVPNYAAGRNMAEGVERVFKGEIVGKDLTKWGKAAQLDFSVELAKAKASGADGIFIFYPGKAGSAFIKQYEQAGLIGKLPLYTAFTVDSISLPKMQKGKMKGVLGSLMTQEWAPDMMNAQNQRFVRDFRAKHGTYPSFYAAQSYDMIFLIKSAVEAVNGNLKDMDGMRAAMEKADYPSVRGKYTYGKNHFPIQNFYLRQVTEDEFGNWTTKIIKTVYRNHQDTAVSECGL